MDVRAVRSSYPKAPGNAKRPGGGGPGRFARGEGVREVGRLAVGQLLRRVRTRAHSEAEICPEKYRAQMSCSARSRGVDAGVLRVAVMEPMRIAVPNAATTMSEIPAIVTRSVVTGPLPSVPTA